MDRSRGGVSTKIHACTDALGNAVRLLATGGQAEYSPLALPSLADLTPGKVIVDTAYDSNENQDYCAQHQIKVVIPNRNNCLENNRLYIETCCDRNKIERFFGRSKQHWRLATHYEKTIISFLNLWHIAAALDCPHVLDHLSLEHLE